MFCFNIATLCSRNLLLLAFMIIFTNPFLHFKDCILIVYFVQKSEEKNVADVEYPVIVPIIKCYAQMKCGLGSF